MTPNHEPARPLRFPSQGLDRLAERDEALAHGIDLDPHPALGLLGDPRGGLLRPDDLALEIDLLTVRKGHLDADPRLGNVAGARPEEDPPGGNVARDPFPVAVIGPVLNEQSFRNAVLRSFFHSFCLPAFAFVPLFRSNITKARFIPTMLVPATCWKVKGAPKPAVN